MNVYLLPFLFLPMLSFAQVGIGTTQPQQDLHIAGDTSTIRIESLNATNNPFNNGIDLAPVSIDGFGNFTLVPQYNTPLEFLLEENNFIPDNPSNLDFNTGTVINSDLASTSNEAIIITKAITIPQPSIIEVNYAVTMLFAGDDLKSNTLTPITDAKSRTGEIFFRIDLNSDGLNTTEISKKYGIKGIYYTSSSGGVAGYAYVNSQGYVTLPTGNHTIYFYGVVKDGNSSYTSIGFGGSKDYLKIRLYN